MRQKVIINYDLLFFFIMINKEIEVIEQEKLKIIQDNDEGNFNCTYSFTGEDHTLGNMLKMMLLRNPKIRFAAYRKPHPLENKIEIKIQTNGEITANEAFKEAFLQAQHKETEYAFAKSGDGYAYCAN